MHGTPHGWVLLESMNCHQMPSGVRTTKGAKRKMTLALRNEKVRGGSDCRAAFVTDGLRCHIDGTGNSMAALRWNQENGWLLPFIWHLRCSEFAFMPTLRLAMLPRLKAVT